MSDDDEVVAITRVTVNLGPLALKALKDMVELTEDTKTQVINKALQMYAIVQHAQAAGGGALIQEKHGDKPMQVRFH